MNDQVSEIKSRLDIVDVVSSYVQLKKAGRNYKGLCPFHGEKTPSFVVSTEKQICHCFGCNKGGDIFSFIEEIEGVNFAEALQLLADRAGVKIEKKAFNKEKKGEKDEFFKAHDLACKFFEEQLYKTNDGKKVLKYLHKRGLNEETIKEFRIGFAPDKYDQLHPMLLKKGITKKTLIKSGFVSSKNLTDDRIYDKYRARLMFPIFNYFGKICGFGGRALKKDQMPKYLNSPENIIYNKSRVLYGLSHAKKSIKEKDQIVLVEGYFDVTLPYQEGVQNVVATSGTALTKDQVQKIKRLTPNVTTCFDSDKAGFEATKRAYELVQGENLVMKSVSLDEKDPADLVRDQGGKVFLEKLKNAKDFFIFFMDKLIGENDVTTIDGRREVLKELLPLFKKISPSTMDFYVRELSTKLDMPERLLYDEIELFKLPRAHPAQKSETVETDYKFHLEEILLAIILEYPELFSEVSKIVDKNSFNDDLQDIYKALSNQYNSARIAHSKWEFDKGVLAERKRKIDVLRVYAEEKYSEFSKEILGEELQKLVDRMKKRRRIGRLKEIHLEIEKAENSGDKEKLMILLREHQQLLSQ